MVIENIFQGQEIPIYGDGKNVRDWIYVEDHVRGLDMIQEYGELYEVYNIGGNNERSNMEIVEMISFSMVPASAPTISLAFIAHGIFILIRFPVINAR